MREGHPYLTEEFDALRATQRRAREVISLSTETASWDFAIDETLAPGPSVQTEDACRAAAQELLGSLKDWLAENEAEQRWKRIDKAVPTGADGAWVTAVGRLEFPPRPRGLEHDELKLLHTAYGLLILADAVAADS